jgi:Zn-dependent protease with chaperone function
MMLHLVSHNNSKQCICTNLKGWGVSYFSVPSFLNISNMTIKDIIFLSTVISSVCVVVKYIIKMVVFVLSNFSKKVFEDIDIKEDLLVFLSIFSLFTFFLFVFDYLKFLDGSSFPLVLSMILASIPLSYFFLIHPIYYLIKYEKILLPNSKQGLIDRYSKNGVSFRIINTETINAYATGVLPFTKVVLLGKNIFTLFSDKEIECLILHEMGHISGKHLLKLYIANLVCVSISITIFRELLPIIQAQTYDGILVGAFGSAQAAFAIIFTGLIQRRLEKNADSFAAKIAGKENYKAMLLKLNDETNKGLEQWAINYPNLNERLENVEKI